MTIINKLHFNISTKEAREKYYKSLEMIKLSNRKYTINKINNQVTITVF